MSRPHSVAGRAPRLLLPLLAVALLTLLLRGAAPADAASLSLVISQVYGGGGNSGAPYTNDFIELFNRSSDPVNVGGWSVQYASATGTTWTKTNLPQMILAPGQYLLVQQAAGSTASTALPAPDAGGTTAMSATAGKVALVNNTSLLTGSGCPAGSSVVDFVGYGSANCAEGTATPALSNSMAARRLANGCTDTDSNSGDFAVAPPAPRNSASSFTSCSTSTPTSPTGTGDATPDPVVAGNVTLLTVSVTPGATPTSTSITVVADLSGIGGASAQPLFDDGSNGDTVAGDNLFSFLASVPGATSPGAKSLPVTINDAQARSGSTSIALMVQAPATPSTTVVISQLYGGGGNSGATFSHDFIELYNLGSSPVSLAGWSVQYASAGGTSWSVTPLSGSIAPGRYLLIQEGTNGGAAPALPTPDGVGTINLSATAGKVALVSSNSALSGGCPGDSAIIDLVGYGSSASCVEGAGPAPAPSNSAAAIRAGGGATDTNQNSADFSTGSPTPRNSTFGDDAAPIVSATTPAAGASDVALGSNLAVTFSEPVNVAGSWFTISCTVSGSHTATVSGGPISFTLDPTTDFAGSESCTVTLLAAQVTDQDSNDPPDAMAANVSWGFSTVAVNACELSYTPVYTIQGSGTASPLAGSTVTTQGVVTADFQLATQQSGFYLQDAIGDGDGLTSDGIFVFAPGSADVAVGDVVRLSARVVEFNGLTELTTVSALSICASGTPLAPTVVTLPEVTNGELERFEGMLVTFPQTLTVSQNFFQGRYGQVTLSSGGRLPNPTNLFAPGPAAVAQADENARRLLVLDDGRGAQNPNPIPYIGEDNTLRAGDTVNELTGVLDYGLITANSTTRDYRLQPTVAPSFSRVNGRTPAPEAVGGNVRVASFNVLNYFNGNGVGGGFPTPRGANNLAEFNRQRSKIIAAITAMDADVIGLMELENDARPNSAIEDLVAGLNAATAPDRYHFIDTGVVGTDEIRVGLLYQPARVTPVGSYALLTSAVDPRFDDGKNRPALAQSFARTGSGATFTVVVNHLKSKGSACTDVGDPDLGDGQGNCNLTRTRAAQALTDWLATDPTQSGDPDFLIIGDMNAYAQEDPIRAIRAAGYDNVIERFVGAAAYSYIFDGFSGYLDHALASGSLAGQVSGATEWHINADEPSVIDYNTEFKPQDLYSPTPYRASDHDPVIVGLALNAPPTASAGGPYSIPEGSGLLVTAGGSDPDDDALTYAWDLDNDGTFESAGQSVTLSAAGRDGPSSFTVRLRVTDPGGLYDVALATVQVLNVAPSVDAPTLSASPSTVGSPVTAGATFSDPGPDAPFSCTVDYGDGSGAQLATIQGTSCQGPAHSYGAVGAYTVTVTVSDKEGQSGTRSVSHAVHYPFGGFYAPLATLPALSEVNAGSTIQIRFSLGGYRGLDIFAAGSPSSRLIACGSTALLEGGVPVEGPGNSGLTYSAATDQYQLNWKSDKVWAGSCRQLIVQLSDGSTHRANVRFR